LFEAAAGKPDASVFGAVVSEQAVMATEASMAVAMRRLRWIMVGSPESREKICRWVAGRIRYSRDEG
jgi:hypothetical protein